MTSKVARYSSVAVLLFASFLPVWAGPTGLTVIPTADVLAPATGSIEFEAAGKQVPFGGDCDRSVLLQIGLAQNMEAGIDTSISSSERPWLNAKWIMMNETLRFPAMAVGLQGVGKDTTAEPYFALSRDAGSVRLHTGAIRFEQHTSWIFGVESSLGPGLAACGDYVSGNAGTTSLGLSWEISDVASVTAARIFANDSEEEDNWYFNIGYAIAWSQ